MSKTTYKSDIVLGDTYRDDQTGFVGVATAAYFFQYGCERIQVEAFDKTTQNIRTNTFDAPRLTNMVTGKKATVDRNGGPGDPNEGRPSINDRSSIVGR
jgi:hypothetical protein